MRPVVRVNMAMTMDGKVTRPDGKWYGLTSSEDKNEMQRIRSLCDAIIVGRNSIENDDPPVQPPGGSLLPVMICRSRLPGPDLKFFRSPVKPLLFTANNLDTTQLKEHCEIIQMEKDRLTPGIILDKLADRSRNLLLEGGPSLNHSFFREDMVDYLHITIVPFMVGARNLPAIVDGKLPFDGFEHKRWKLASFETKGNEVFLRYDRIRES